MSAPIRRALISVSDKTGIDELGQALAARGIEILSTGGSAAALRAAGVAVIEVSDFTGFPEIMDGRVKTLQPAIHGGLLAVRDNPEHEQAMREHNIAPIDLLVVNLYPFEATAASGADFAACIENIDIGGPALIRAAAKNHAFVTVVVDPADYSPPRRGARRRRRRNHAGLPQSACGEGVCPHRRLRRRHCRLVQRRAPRAVSRPPGLRRRPQAGAALWREPTPGGRLLCLRRRPAGRRQRCSDPGQGTQLQQP